MGKKVDLVGQKFGQLVVAECVGVRPTGSTGAMRRYWLCRCSCGGEIEAHTQWLRSGNKKCCGCTVVPHGHSMANSGTYRSWCAMLQRCRYPEKLGCNAYVGVTVDPRWDGNFRAFLADMGERPEGMTLDRIDPSLGYCKENCRWATSFTQGNNKRTTIRLTYGGRTQSLTEWAAELGFKRHVLYHRIVLAKWPVERALTQPQYRR